MIRVISFNANGIRSAIRKGFYDWLAEQNADFVCIEPWCGIADAWNAGGEIAAKEGIEKLEPGHVFSRRWQVRIIPG